MGNRGLKPERAPDFAIDQWWFYWPEMKQWNNATECWFAIAVVGGEMCYSEDGMWESYEGMTTVDGEDNCAERVLEAYRKFHKEIEDSLLGE